MKTNTAGRTAVVMIRQHSRVLFQHPLQARLAVDAHVEDHDLPLPARPLRLQQEWHLEDHDLPLPARPLRLQQEWHRALFPMWVLVQMWANNWRVWM